MVHETEFYDLLGVSPTATELELKKGYRKAAIKYHPDKNPGSTTAAAQFQAVSRAYDVLSDPDLRAVYDAHGSSGLEKHQAENEVDPVGLFTRLFSGGEAFRDIIGDLTMLKNFASAQADPEDAQKAQAAEGSATTETDPTHTASQAPAPAHIPSAAPSTTSPIPTDSPSIPTSTSTATSTATTTPTPAPTATTSTSLALVTPSHPSGPSATSSTTTAPPIPPRPTQTTQHQHLSKAEKAQMAAEKRAQAIEAHRKRAEEHRQQVAHLVAALEKRVQPFVDQRPAGPENDAHVAEWTKKLSAEAEDLKLASFGIELLQTVGAIYATKGSAYLKAQKSWFGKNWYRGLKAKRDTFRETWDLLSSAINVQMAFAAIQDDEGAINQEQVGKDLESKILTIAWKGTRYEVSQTLREVCDVFLKAKDITEDVRKRRAEALVLIGTIWRAVEPDPDQEQRRELEKIVEMEGSKTHKHKKTKAPAEKEPSS